MSMENCECQSFWFCDHFLGYVMLLFRLGIDVHNLPILAIENDPIVIKEKVFEHFLMIVIT